MTASGYMPDVVVEVAFNAGWSTPAASRTWTDVSTYVELAQGIDIGFGRSDELSTADANTLKVVLDNTSGRFTPEYASGANYPNVKLGRPIRVKSTRVGGSASTRFLGFIDGWAPSAAGANSTVTVTATSQIARLGLESTFTDSFTDAFASLTSLYKFSEAALPLVDSKGALPNIDASVGTIGFRQGTGPDGASTAVRFTSGDSVSPTGLAPLFATLPDDVIVEGVFVVSTSSDRGANVNLYFSDSSTASLEVGSAAIGATVPVKVSAGGGTITIVGSFDNDGLPHHCAMRLTLTDTYLYIGGELAGTDAGSVLTRNATQVEVISTAATGYTDVSYIGISDDLAGLPERGILAPAATTTATASGRLTAYATYAGIESTDIDATTETLTAYPLYGKTMLEAMRAAETTDGGVLYDSAAGALTYNDRESRYTSTSSSFTLSAATQQVEASVAPKLDRSGLINEATVTQTDGDNVLARVRDQTSIDAYGNARQSWEIQGEYDECYQAAAWSVFIHGEPETRIPNLELDFLPLSTSLQDSVFAATIGTRFTVTGLPADFPASSLEFFLEGYTETIGPESYRLSLNVSKRDSAKWDVWTVEDATYGAWTDNPLAW